MIGEAPYQTPRGYYDRAFIYTFDGDSLTNGTSPSNLSVPIEQNSQFIVRRVAGLETVATKIYLREYNLAQWSSAPIQFLYEMAVIPEKTYPNNSFITFDLQTIAKATNAGGGGVAVPYPQIIFHGVKRYAGTKPAIEPSTYPYRVYAYTYQMDVTVNWAYFLNPAAGGTTEPPRTFTVPINNYDFELMQVSVVRYDGVDCSTDLKLQLYTTDLNASFSSPVLLQYLQDNNTNNNYNGVFPCPPQLYPAGSEIRFDVTSMLSAATTLPVTYSFSFNGVQRFPCSDAGK